MKKLILLSFLTVGLSFTSCSKDENETSTSEDLIGAWSFISYIDDEGEELADDCDSKDSITFMSDNSFNFTYHGINNTEDGCTKNQDAMGVWEYQSDKVLKLDYSTDEYTSITEAEFQITGNILTLTINEGEGEYQEKYQKN